MGSKTLALLFAGSMLATAAVAQTAPSSGTAPPAAARETRPPAAGQENPAPAAAAPQAADRQAGAGQWLERPNGAWLASNLLGMDVYNNDNETIGEVGDILIDRQGRTTALVVDIGGFLGIGEREVAVPFGNFLFLTGPASTVAATADAPVTAGATTPGGTNRVIGTEQALTNSRVGIGDGTAGDARREALTTGQPPAGTRGPPVTGYGVTPGTVPTVADRDPAKSRQADRAFAQQSGMEARDLPLSAGPAADAPAAPYRIMLNTAREDLAEIPAWRPAR